MVGLKKGTNELCFIGEMKFPLFLRGWKGNHARKGVSLNLRGISYQQDYMLRRQDSLRKGAPGPRSASKTICGSATCCLVRGVDEVLLLWKDNPNFPLLFGNRSMVSSA